MRLYIKQHVFTWGDRFSVYDEEGNERYYAEGEVFSFGKKLHLTDCAGKEVAYIHQEAFSFKPRYYISRGEQQLAEVVKEFSFFKQEYSIEGLGWVATGDFFDHEFEINDGDETVVRVFREWFTFGDAYAIDIAPAVDEAIALAVALVIDAVLDAGRN